MPPTLPYEAEPILNRLRTLGVVPSDATWTALPDGTINRVWRVDVANGEPMIVRVGPAREEAEAGPSWMRPDALACEAVVLDQVRGVVPCVPVPLAAGFRDRDRPWLVQRVIPGHHLGTVLPHLSMGERNRLWTQLGRLASCLHGVSAPWFGTPDGRQQFPDWPSMVRSDAEGLLDDARRYGLDLEPFRRLLATIERHREDLEEVGRPSVVHSDLDVRHVFAQEGADGWAISGVIDWEYARYVDPYSESLLVEMLSRSAGNPDREAFVAGYGLEIDTLADAGFQARQEIYRGIAEGWALTDTARLAAGRNGGH